MGADGGTIPTRGELVKLQKKKGRVEKDLELESKWMRCALSLQPLREPIVACPLGKLFNKEEVISFLLDRQSYADQALVFKYIRNLKDVTVLHLTRTHKRIASKDSSETDQYSANFKCPVTESLMNGKSRFVYIKPCGCVLSYRSLQEIPTSVCHRCGKDFVLADVYEINPTEEMAEKMVERLMEARRIEKQRKAKKRKGTIEDDINMKKSKKSTSEMAVKTLPKESIEDDSALMANSSTYKNLFIDPTKKKESNDTFTCRAVHRGHLGF
eukprot:CFRG8371T1